MITPPRDPRQDGSMGSDRRLDFDERRINDRRGADAVRMDWLQQNTADLRELRSKFDELLHGQDVATRTVEVARVRLEVIAEALGIDERGRHVKGGIAETFAKLSGVKLAVIWLAGAIIAVMGLYSTIKEVGQRWLGQ